MSSSRTDVEAHRFRPFLRRVLASWESPHGPSVDNHKQLSGPVLGTIFSRLLPITVQQSRESQVGRAYSREVRPDQHATSQRPDHRLPKIQHRVTGAQGNTVGRSGLGSPGWHGCSGSTFKHRPGTGFNGDVVGGSGLAAPPHRAGGGVPLLGSRSRQARAQPSSHIHPQVRVRLHIPGANHPTSASALMHPRFKTRHARQSHIGPTPTNAPGCSNTLRGVWGAACIRVHDAQCRDEYLNSLLPQLCSSELVDSRRVDRVQFIVDPSSSLRVSFTAWRYSLMPCPSWWRSPSSSGFCSLEDGRRTCPLGHRHFLSLETCTRYAVPSDPIVDHC